MGKLLIVGLDALSWPLVVHGGERWPFFNTLNGQMFYSGALTEEEKEEIEARLKGWGY